MRRVGSLLAVLALVGTSCGQAEPAAGIRVVATTTVLGDVVANVVGDDATVEVLLPIGADPHDFGASARQAAQMASADLVVANGLGLEEGLTDILASLAADGQTVLRIGDAVEATQPAGEPADPHVWMDPVRMVEAVRLIGAEMESVAPGGDWEERAATYAAELQALDAEIRQTLSDLSRRQLVTNHDSLGYFARRYDLDVVGVIVSGGTTLAEPSSADLTALVQTIRDFAIPSIFTESTEPSGLAEAVAAEVGGVEVIELFIGSLGPPGSGAETYVQMMRYDAESIAAGLR